MKTFTINIAFTISEPLRSEIINSSLEIREKYNSDFWIDDKQYFLHLPLYLIDCPEHNREKIKQVTEECAKLFSKIKVEVINTFYNGKGLIMIGFAINPDLYKFHLKALDSFNPLRENCLRDKYKDENYLNQLEIGDKEKVLKYGHIWVLEKYAPHITIARIKNNDELANKIVEEYAPSFSGKSCNIERLQVQEAIFGENDRNIMLADFAL
jgi:2'-5' RNA ligase